MVPWPFLSVRVPQRGVGRGLVRAAIVLFLALPGLATRAHAGPAPVDTTLARANEFYRSGDWPQARGLVSLLIDHHEVAGPALVDALALLARCDVQLKLDPEARATFGELLDEDPHWRPNPDIVRPEEIASFQQALSDHQKRSVAQELLWIVAAAAAMAALAVAMH